LDVRYSETAKKQLKGMDKQTAGCILGYMGEKVAKADTPRRYGRPLKGVFGDFWHSRVGGGGSR
jgi:mRNA interferase RelE/StbE